MHMFSVVTKVLVFSSGASYDILSMPQCAIERGKYAGIGIIVLLSSVFASLSGAYALYIVPMSLGAASLLAVFWGAFVFVIDRLMLSTLSREMEASRKSIRISINMVLGLARRSPRLLLAILIGAVVAVPVEIRLFRSEIDGQIQRSLFEAASKKAMMEVDLLNAENLSLKEDIKHKEEDRERLLELARNELEGVAGTKRVGAGPVYQARWRDF